MARDLLNNITLWIAISAATCAFFQMTRCEMHRHELNAAVGKVSKDAVADSIKDATK